MNVIFFDDNEVRKNLLPLTYTRPIARLRLGITTLEQKWQQLLGDKANTCSYLTATYLTKLFPAVVRRDNLLIAANVVATPALVTEVTSLSPGEALMQGETLLAFRGTAHSFDKRHFKRTRYSAAGPVSINYLYELFEHNGAAIEADFERLTAGRESRSVPATCTVIGDPKRLFLEAGAVVDGATLNTREGAIYIGKDVEVMEGACVRGPFSALDGSKVRIGSKVYGATSLGPQCKIGGEVENTIIIGYSNKAHEGFLGDAVIGEWCNLGGGTTTSNLKNDYGEIKLWNYNAQRFLRTGRQFCGPIMGDHCKTGINSMLNTATVLGVAVNIHGAGFPRNFVPSFMEGNSSAGFKNVDFEVFLATARRVMARRGIELTDDLRDVYSAIYNISDRYK